ncbi:ABC transporter permease [Streptomyces cadmiisoli]|uniref:Transport permease protein n=1 Tax=Streptomyces cadmiisoli TaxID=2184053 RepID=A0A2Z4JEG9_9ACTN|nr:ABC transporter permease [Streptomyces cadmiisoli]AWW43509.1 ABC transporter permease [Streptomyces cadmiisoli]
MTTNSLTVTPETPRSRPRLVRLLRDSWTVTKRNLRRTTRIPESFVLVLVQAVMFVLLFSYVLGGAVVVPGAGPSGYREFIMAGIFTQVVMFGVAGASTGVAEDMAKGLVDRFRSLPVARSAVLMGRTLADVLQTAATLLVLAVVALLVGWRIHHGLLPALGAFVLLLLFGYAFSWVGAWVGLSVRTSEAAGSAGVIWVFPMTFLSNAFVPVATMPGWLKTIAYWNPLSATVQACRQLFGNPGADPADVWPMQHPVLASLTWSLVILVVFSWLATRKYRSATR